MDMTDRRNDAGLAIGTVDDIVRRYGRTPDNLLVDTGHAERITVSVSSACAAWPMPKPSRCGIRWPIM
jgi:hypothetical protein